MTCVSHRGSFTALCKVAWIRMSSSQFNSLFVFLFPLFHLQSSLSLPLADQPDSARFNHQAELNSAGDPGLVSAPTNGFQDILVAPGSDPLHSRRNHNGVGAAPEQQLLNPGPSSRANKGSSSSIPYIDCSDIDSECEAAKGHRAHVGHSNANDSNEDEPAMLSYKIGASRNGGQVGNLFGPVNGFYHTNHQGLMQPQQQGMLGNRSNIEQPKFSLSHELTDDEVLSNGGSFHARAPLHSTLLDEIFQGREVRGAVVGRPFGSGTRSQCSSPVIRSFHHRTNSLSHAEMTNGHGQPRSGTRWDNGGHSFSKHPSPESPTVPLSFQPLNHYGSYSPILSNRTPPQVSKLYTNNNMRNRSDTDPFILSQVTSTPIHHRDPSRLGQYTQAPCSAPVERRMILTNGNHTANLGISGLTKPETPKHLFGPQRKPSNHSDANQSVQMIDGSTSSGSDTSDTESDVGSSTFGQPLMYGNPAVLSSLNSVNGNVENSSPLKNSNFSLESLPLGGGVHNVVEEQRRYRFNEEDGSGRVFSCWAE